MTKLDLSGQKLKVFPKEILELKNLKKLNLSNNLLKEIPKEIENLKFLETLDISNNRIENIYAKVFKLKKLKILNLNNNKIKSLPQQINNLNGLVSLHLANNFIEFLPNELFSVYSLRELDLSRNKIKILSPKIENLSNLRKLWLNYLILEQFPERELKRMNSLLAIYCYGKIETNPIIQKTFSDLSKIKGNSLANLKFLETQKEILKDLKDMNVQSELFNNKIFISYSHQDKYWLNRIKTHLNVLKHSLNIEIDVWDDEKLMTGDDWEEKINESLNNAGIAIFVISTDFLASEFITKKEVPIILENAKKKGVKIMPIIVEPCLFTDSILSKYQAANPPSESLGSLQKAKAESYLLHLTKDIKKILLKS
ncbi:leucine-rich repeat domain-containing protein [Chryseobacterium turcicum]|uniref:Leucine-rich repeat domain-containing protein n=1 Tax=Chryseobacterium turcicum TaxID=2898076 RepID=A0A9Q3YUE8_9FLAO|nr:leucine-rich repeat domain-containing protein [Chryseobacterium turcicum]MCD1116291.1 leucine-rich repeat domain-containing protein [Chryseobacterium turcicum]